MLERQGRWDAFWYESGSPLALGLFRILFACCLWREVGTTHAKSTFAIHGDFHLPFVDWIPLVSSSGYDWIHTLQYPLIVLFGVGLFTRLSCGALLALQGYVFFADQLNFRNHPYFFLLLLLLLLCSAAPESLSLGAVLRGRGLLGRDRPFTFQRLIQLQVCISYFYAALHKLHPAYLRGEILAHKLGRDLLDRTSGEVFESLGLLEEMAALAAAPLTMIVLAWVTVVLELAIPVGLWFRRTRAVAILLGIGFHLGIAFSMNIMTFSLAMIASYVLFLDRETVPRLVRSSVPRFLVVTALVVVLLVAVACAPAAPRLEPGPWRAWLESPGGELPFGLEFEVEGGKLSAVLHNGDERIPVPRVALSDGELRLAMEPYDSVITARVTDGGRRLHGTWRKTAGAGLTSVLPFRATVGSAPRFEPLAGEAGGTIAGRWSVEFDSDDERAIGVFEERGAGEVVGTFLTTTGDYRFLAGRYEARRLRLSCFDGAHAFLFDARLREDDTLAGEFWSRDNWHESWTARPDPGARLPDAFTLTRWLGGRELQEIAFPDLDGRSRTLADPEFAGRARILEVFGSWCPNCNDAAELLVELDRTYRDRGLSILGLGFELTGEFERDAEQLRRYTRHHGIEFPVLLAGLSDKSAASVAFPLIDRVRSFPTTIFMDADGEVTAVHQGFRGPATGEDYAELRAEFVERIEALLAGAEKP